MTEWYLDYQVEALNWADQNPEHHSLEEMRKLTDAVLIGGLNHSVNGSYRDLSIMLKSPSDLSGGDRETVKMRVKRKVEAAIRAAGPKVIISGGCGWGIGSLPRFGLWEEVMEEVGAEINAVK